MALPREVATALWGLALVAEEEDDTAQAREHLEDALAIFEEIWEVECVGGVQGSLAQVARIGGRDADAVRHVDIALERARSVDDDASEMVFLALRACLVGGDPEAAERKLELLRGRIAVLVEMRTVWWLFEATGKQEYAVRARELLRLMQEGAPGEDREPMVKGNRLYREILANETPPGTS